MPANLSPEYYEAEKEYKAAKTKEEKIVGLEKMLAGIPKHKGTEKMQADIKRRISQLKKIVDSKKSKKGISYRVHPEGAGQIILLGSPNSGKSQLLATLTNAEPKIGEYPFTTVTPYPGMMDFMGVQIQLVDMPPMTPEHTENFVIDNLRGSDGVVVVADGGAPDPLEGIEFITDYLKKTKIVLESPGRVGTCAHQDSEEKENGGHMCPSYKNEDSGVMHKPALIAYNKYDLVEARDTFSVFKELYQGDLPIFEISALQEKTLENLRKNIFMMLNVIRVYSKAPHKEPDMDSPFTVPVGSTLIEFAEHVHKELAENLKFGRIWGSSKFDGQQVKRDYILQDEDIVELDI